MQENSFFTWNFSISCENMKFYAKKNYFAPKILQFLEKNRSFERKNRCLIQNLTTPWFFNNFMQKINFAIKTSQFFVKTWNFMREDWFCIQCYNFVRSKKVKIDSERKNVHISPFCSNLKFYARKLILRVKQNEVEKIQLYKSEKLSNSQFLSKISPPTSQFRRDIGIFVKNRKSCACI